MIGNIFQDKSKLRETDACVDHNTTNSQAFFSHRCSFRFPCSLRWLDRSITTNVPLLFSVFSDHTIKNRQQSICQGFPGLITSYSSGKVSVFWLTFPTLKAAKVKENPILPLEKIFVNKQNFRKMIKIFRFKDHTLGFRPQTQKLRQHRPTQGLALWLKGGATKSRVVWEKCNIAKIILHFHWLISSIVLKKMFVFYSLQCCSIEQAANFNSELNFKTFIILRLSKPFLSPLLKGKSWNVVGGMWMKSLRVSILVRLYEEIRLL